MLGDFIYSAPASATASADASASARAQTIAGNPVRFADVGTIEKSIKRFFLFAMIFIVCGLIWLFAISPSKAFTVVEVDTKGLPGFTKDDVLEYAGITSGSSYISVNTAETEQILLKHPLVESVKVDKKFPDRLSIFIEPRQAVAAIFAEVNGLTQTVYVDRYGVPFKIGNTSGFASPSWLPVVSGIPVGTSKLGTPLSAVFTPLFTQIGAIYDEAPELWQFISEIKIIRKDFGKYELVLFPLKYPVRLRMGGDISKENLRYALLMLDVCRKENNAPDEIDVRSGIGVVKAKEARFGE